MKLLMSMCTAATKCSTLITLATLQQLSGLHSCIKAPTDISAASAQLVIHFLTHPSLLSMQPGKAGGGGGT